MNSVDILTQHLRCLGEIGLERVVWVIGLRVRLELDLMIDVGR